MTDYDEFLATKQRAIEPAGFNAHPDSLPLCLRPLQHDATLWALRMGRSGLFLDTGLGKTLIDVAWADRVVTHTGRPVLILAPLAVSRQIVREAEQFGFDGVVLAESKEDVTGRAVYVTNYEKLHKFDASAFSGVCLDEGSILKSHDGKTRNALIETFGATPYKLISSATPCPNDHEELGNYAEFLGVMTRVEMLATFFVHDSSNGEWRLKGHAEAEFWRWVASWALLARRPSDLGHSDDGYILPELHIIEHYVDSEPAKGQLFATAEKTLTGQRKARRKSLTSRVDKAVHIAGMDSRQCLIWCELNDEQEAVHRALKPSALSISGSDTDESKVAREEMWRERKFPHLVSKVSIFGWGLNWQHCCKMVFIGLTHSFEQFYQAFRRCWRYGQLRDVEVHIITSEAESAVWDDVKAKWKAHDAMFESMLVHTREVNREALQGTARQVDDYATGHAKGDGWEVYQEDCVERLRRVETDTVDMEIFSPPFASLFTYSNSPRDMGNCSDLPQFMAHFRFAVKELYRVLKPGRLMCVHCMNLPTSKERHGYIGIEDFRGDLIRLFQSAGFIFHSEVCIWKDPVTAMQRTKALGLLHKQVKKDSCMSRQGIPDYVVTMRKPGKNPEPVDGPFEEYVGEEELPPLGDPERYSIQVWQRYASPVWMDIDQTRVLPYADARAERDERHICPLQLDVIARCLDLWSNPGDLVLSPFAGIGSEGYEAIKRGRRFLGCELKPSYFSQAVKNLERAEAESRQKSLFDLIPA